MCHPSHMYKVDLVFKEQPFKEWSHLNCPDTISCGHKQYSSHVMNSSFKELKWANYSSSLNTKSTVCHRPHFYMCHRSHTYVPQVRHVCAASHTPMLDKPYTYVPQVTHLCATSQTFNNVPQVTHLCATSHTLTNVSLICHRSLLFLHLPQVIWSLQ